MVLRLFGAFGPQLDWNSVPQIADFLAPSGQERPGAAMDSLKEKEWNNAWDHFVSCIFDDEEHSPWGDGYRKLQE